MEHKSSGWKFFALLFGALLAAAAGYYVYKQQNSEYDPWEEPWENSSSPVELDDEDEDDNEDSPSYDADAKASDDETEGAKKVYTAE